MGKAFFLKENVSDLVLLKCRKWATENLFQADTGGNGEELNFNGNYASLLHVAAKDWRDVNLGAKPLEKAIISLHMDSVATDQVTDKERALSLYVLIQTLSKPLQSLEYHSMFYNAIQLRLTFKTSGFMSDMQHTWGRFSDELQDEHLTEHEHFKNAIWVTNENGVYTEVKDNKNSIIATIAILKHA